MIYYRKPSKKQNKIENKYNIVDMHSYPINKGRIFLSNNKKYYIIGVQILQKSQFYVDLKVNLQLDIERQYRQGMLQLGVCLIIDNKYDNPILIRNIEIPNLYIGYTGFYIYNLEKSYKSAHVGIYLLNQDENFKMIPIDIRWGDLDLIIYTKN